ncbi:DNA-directed RNA polymerase I subunit RPA1 [Microplitis mediator]|uniref:DNA-directed RNA polymerase I subunit RPA1 n=1 Tax=Microplitis mediator TaxID=375433 RepID=UPI0025536882|nr:DNA-directed RNA polymerase I subunit RPA1 [Microplitis mediator]
MSHRFKSRVSAKHLDPCALTFSMYSSEDIKRISAVKIKSPLSFSQTGLPLRGGLYDPSLGPTHTQSDPCGTCSETFANCPGHFGHIELPVPVVNPLFHKVLCSLIKLTCLSCFTLQIPSHEKLLLIGKFRMIMSGFYTELEDLEHEIGVLVDSKKDLNAAELEFLRESVTTIINDLKEKKSVHDNDRLESLSNPTTKNINIQCIKYIDNAIKRCDASKMCISCHRPFTKVSINKNKIMIQHVSNLTEDDEFSDKKVANVMLTPDQSKAYLRKVWRNDKDVLKVMIPCLSSIDIEFPTDIFFFDLIPVVPPKTRPPNMLRNQVLEHPRSQVYKSIMSDCLVLRNIIQAIQDGNTEQLPQEGLAVYDQIRGKTPTEKLQNAWQGLQANVDHLMDRDMSKTSESANCLGLKQIIEKKEGVIRMHMMGKRVDFAARSVITPDPNINIDEIGFPECFAKRLSYPVAVTPWNVTELRQMIINGPNVHPGANMIEIDGWVQRLSATDSLAREAIAKRLLTSNKDSDLAQSVKIVHRHLQNGDIMLLNRQPTLHKPSIMAHKARILKGEQTIRLHYSNCKAYNADFDGDEMNAHFPQNELGRSEGYNLASVPTQYLVPKDGTPLGGLIQDHVIGGVRLTLRGNFFTKDDYMNLVLSALTDHVGQIKLLPPAIIKPIEMWSGKQVVSTVIINLIPRGKALINLTSGAKIRASAWEAEKPRAWKCGEEFEDPNTMSEAEVILRNGELLCGILDKTHYGATPYGLVHCIYELYGGACSTKMLSSFAKLFQMYLRLIGFTLGVEDILVVESGDEKRREVISRCKLVGESVQKEILKLPEETPQEVVVEKIEEAYWRNKKFRAQIDHKYKSTMDKFTNAINKASLGEGLLKKFPSNNLQFMVQTGAKGSDVNRLQISGLLAQIELEGKRPPLMISGRGLPCFPPYYPSPRAGGYIDGRFMTGILPPEFFFHCMAGREGLIDTAVKTSRSGYLQRCLIKHLEGVSVHYDSTVRDSDGSLIQMLYGEDGEDITKSRFLRKEQMNFLAENKNAIIDKKLLKQLKDPIEYGKIMKSVKKLRKWKSKHGSEFQRIRISPFSKYSQDHYKAESAKNKEIDPGKGRTKAAWSLSKKWEHISEEVKNRYAKECNKCPEPITADRRQDLDYGVLTERLESLIDNYMESRKSFTSTISHDQLRDLICLKLMNTLCPAGEPVGLLAAQSIGEPSTQMTLNTFHFAGRGDMNVTLGIPRLREILMMASKNIKTPSMEIPFNKNLKNLTRSANRLRMKLTRCTLADVLKSVHVERKMQQRPSRQLEYYLTVEFLPHKYYKHEFCLSSKQVLERTETLFFKELFREIKKVAKKSGTTLLNVDDKKKRNTELEDSLLDGRIDDDVEEADTKSNKRKADIGENHESSDEEDGNTEDTFAVKRAQIHKEMESYDDPEAEEAPEEVSNDIDEENVDDKKSETDENQDEDQDDEIILSPEMLHARQMAAEQRKIDVVSSSSYGIEYDFDVEKYHWFKYSFYLPLKLIKLDLPTIIRDTAKKVVLWETPAIKRAFTFENPEGETILKTDGLNIVEMAKYVDVLDLQRLYTNDIYGISQTYGIEAANRVIVKEVKDVFKMYGITVDPRHLSLIADYMTFEGTFQPLSRKGMETSASPLQQMSFESSLVFLRNATLQGKCDNLISPSGRLMLGQPCKTGTGCFDVIDQPLLSI